MSDKIWKDPRKPTASNGFDTYIPTKEFVFSMDGPLVWNVIGSDPTGKTFGLSGKATPDKKIGVSSDSTVLAQMIHE